MQSRVDIHPLRPDEHDSAGAATVRAFAEYNAAGGWDGYLSRIGDVAGRSEVALVLVATVGGVVAGSATLELDRRIPSSTGAPLKDDEAHLRMFGVDPAFRRRGVARRLVEACIEAARSRGKRRITLDTQPGMLAAQTLYMAHGFRFTGISERVADECLLMYELLLD